MQNIEFVESFETHNDLDHDFPNSLLTEGLLILGHLHNLLVQIAVVRIFHNNATISLKDYQRELASMNECLYPTT